MIHHQPGSVSVQVTILTPSVGSKGYEEPYEKGLVIEEAAGQKLEDHHYDGNRCIATEDPHPWRKQVNIYLSYASFYNPLNFVRSVANWKDPLWSERVLYQTYGMLGLARSLARSWNWLMSLQGGPITRMAGVPQCKLEMVPPAVASGKPAPVLQFQAN